MIWWRSINIKLWIIGTGAIGGAGCCMLLTFSTTTCLPMDVRNLNVVYLFCLMEDTFLTYFLNLMLLQRPHVKTTEQYMVHIQKVQGLNLCPETRHHNWGFLWFSSVSAGKWWGSAWNRQWVFPSIFFPIHDTLILPFDTTWPVYFYKHH